MVFCNKWVFRVVLVKREQRLNSWSRKYIRRFCVIKWKLKAFWSRAFFEDPGNAFWDQYGEGFLKIYYFLKIGVTFKSKIDHFFGQGSTFQYQITLFKIMVHFLWSRWDFIWEWFFLIYKHFLKISVTFSRFSVAFDWWGFLRLVTHFLLISGAFFLWSR